MSLKIHYHNKRIFFSRPPLYKTMNGLYIARFPIPKGEFCTKSNIGFIDWKYHNTYCEIIHLKVDTRYRKLGYGSWLLNYVENHAINNKINKIVLNCSITNIPAVNLYTKHGFFLEKNNEQYKDLHYDSYSVFSKVIK